RLVGRLVDVDVEEARERVAPRQHVVRLGGVERLAGLARERQRFDSRGAIADARVADRKPVLGDPLDDRRRAWLLFDRLAVVALEQGDLLEEAVGPGGGVAAVERDRPRRPVAR